MYWTAESVSMKQPLALARKIAHSPRTPVLIAAEPGSGAGAMAELIHALTFGDGAPFVVIRCGGVPEPAIDAELLGAGDPTRAALERARGGTLFIDDIDLLGMTAQAALVEAIDQSRGLGHGAQTERRTATPDAAFRLIAATAVDLSARARQRLLRTDLLERLGVIHMRIPPLRERPDEVLPLAERCLRDRAAPSPTARAAPTFSDEARRKLLGHPFPGNVDELRAVVERASILQDGDVLPGEAIEFEPSARAGDDPAGAPFGFFLRRLDRSDGERRRPPTLNEIERDYLVWLLREAGGNRTVVARQMGVSYPTVMKKISDYRIDLQAFQRGVPATEVVKPRDRSPHRRRSGGR